MSLIYPIIDQQEELRIDLEKVEDDELVGSLSFGIFWRDLLRNILPEKSEGILVVTENTCGDIVSTSQIPTIAHFPSIASRCLPSLIY